MEIRSKLINTPRAVLGKSLGGSLSPRVGLYLTAVTGLLAIVFIAGVAVGSSSVATETVARVLAAHLLPSGWVDVSRVSEADQAIVWLIRTPRVMVAGLVGAGLAVAGTQLQALFRNPLASPDIIGTSSGGVLGAVLAFSSGLAMRSLFYLPLMAFAGALLALFFVYAISTQRGRTPVTTLLLAGVALNALIGAVNSFLISLQWVRWEVAQEILFWLMGGLDSRTWQHVWLTLPCMLAGLIVAFVYSRELDLLLLGDETALAVGVDVERVKRIILTSAALLTGAAVAVSGLLGFVGLVVPHLVRLIIGPRHRSLLPATALTGAAFLILTDILARTVRPPEEIRLGIITAALGAPFFLYLLIRHQRAAGA
ncbi:MAG TPA: iron chelate uptake ABC transporter family permease subunit [Blastocatellia bacterium]|nr:iron chelate uptake ABC transporter family permease subunit [Blastocatellia bacterium]